jgi:hypothetical protein
MNVQQLSRQGSRVPHFSSVLLLASLHGTGSIPPLATTFTYNGLSLMRLTERTNSK